MTEINVGGARSKEAGRGSNDNYMFCIRRLSVSWIYNKGDGRIVTILDRRLELETVDNFDSSFWLLKTYYVLSAPL
jgi:hypothetical protein